MNAVKKDDSPYISLKEAAALSGYSSDYVGQLIRQGKLAGKQIFSNVAWVTTEEALHEYMERKEKSSSSQMGGRRLRDRFTSPDALTRLVRPLLWTSIVATGVLVLFLAFLLAVSIDQRLEEQSLATEYVE